MTTLDFDRAFGALIGHEGGYVNHPRDPGGETKYGITKRTYPDVDIRNLTLAGAKAIYRRDFWDACECGGMPYAMALVVFDAAVNASQKRAIHWLQTAVGSAADGRIGPNTRRAVVAKRDAGKTADVVIDMIALRNLHNASLGTWDAFGLGWSRRLIRLAVDALT